MRSARRQPHSVNHLHTRQRIDMVGTHLSWLPRVDRGNRALTVILCRECGDFLEPKAPPIPACRILIRPIYVAPPADNPPGTTPVTDVPRNRAFRMHAPL